MDQSFRVLFIDDDEDEFVNIRDIFQEIKTSKYQITWKSSYQEGLKALQANTFDVCLLDYRLGAHTGLDLLKEAQAFDISCPVILLTGLVDRELDLQAMQIGASEYLIKNQLTAPLLERTLRYAMKNAMDMEELHEQKENFKTLLNSTFEGIFVLNKGIVQEVNYGAAEIFGYNSEEMLHRPFLDFIRKSDRSEVEEKLSSTEKFRMESIGIKKDSEEIFVELSHRLVTLKSHSYTLIAVKDLTEMKTMESQILQQDRMASLGLLASSLAHEIGTPLGIIRSRAELAVKKASDNLSLKQDMETVVTQIDRITKLVNSLLHIARTNNSDHASTVVLSKVIDDIINLIKHELDRKNITLRTLIPDDILVKAESGPLGQVLLNLLINSVHAIEEAQHNEKEQAHEILLEARSDDKNVTILVKDTGCGISEKNMKYLFKPFFTTKDVGQGTGLGLATSYKLIHSWGGKISARSKVSEGTTFEITLHKKN
ncbi:MAG: ATP-binding protein [Bdellovibrionota bacterium]